MGKEERQARRATRRERRDSRRDRVWKKIATDYGLTWSNDGDLRDAALSSGLRAVEYSGVIDEEAKEDFAKCLTFSPAAIGACYRTGANRDELWRIFGEAWEQVILAGRPDAEPEPEAPRAQVDIGKVATDLPWQSVTMTGEKASTPWWYWVAPAGLLFLILKR